MRLGITLANDQPDAQFFLNTFIIILYMYMFRAIFCSSSGGQIISIQHLASSLSLSDRPVHRLRKFSIVTLSKWPSSAQVEKELLSRSFSTCALDGLVHRLRKVGIVTLSKWPASAQVEKDLRSSSFSTCALDGHLLIVTIPDVVLIKFDFLKMSKILFETCTCRGL